MISSMRRPEGGPQWGEGHLQRNPSEGEEHFALLQRGFDPVRHRNASDDDGCDCVYNDRVTLIKVANFYKIFLFLG